MHCLPVVHVGRPDTVHLSGNTTLKATKAIYKWTVSGFDICPEDTESIKSPVFSHPNSSRWCVELEKDGGSPRMCFRLVASRDSQPVSATLKAFVLDRGGAKHYVYLPDIHTLKVSERSPLQSVTNDVDTKELGEDWTFECEVSALDVMTEDTSDASEEELQAALAKDLECLLDSKDLADIALIAGGVRLEAHRAVLCARSPVFRAMLSHDAMKEASEGLVEIPDVEPEVVSEMLRYVYTDAVPAPSGATEQLLAACDKYGLQDAKVRCEQQLARRLTVDSAADTAAYAIVHSCAFLQEVCVAFIKQNLELVVGSRGWANMIDKYPSVVKTISELVTEGSERCSSPPAASESQSVPVESKSSAVESLLKDSTPTTHASSSDTVWDSGFTRCERKQVVYVWTISGLTNWPDDTDFVASPCFSHPESIRWEVRLYKRGTEYDVRFLLLENEFGGSTVVDLSVSVIPPEGEKCRIHSLTGYTFQEGAESVDNFECGYLVNDVLTLECEISMVCAVQQCLGEIKPVLQSGLGQDLYSLLESGNFADFKLCTGTVEMGAHRAILAARSPFFACTLRPLSEALERGQLEVPDVKPEVLAEVLHYIYTGKMKNLGCSVGDLLVAAHRFELRDLEKECLTRLSRQLAVGNVVSTAVCAMENKCDALLDVAVEFIRSHFKQVMGSADWMEAIDRHPAAVKRISQLVAEPLRHPLASV